MSFYKQLELNLENLKKLMDDTSLQNRIEDAISLIAENIGEEKPLLVCGNGGSSADAEHIVGELVGRFLKERKAIPAICLSSNSAAITAWANDYEYETIFSRQIEAYGKRGGVLFAISTSGNSKNILRAAGVAKEMGIPIIGLTGSGGGELGKVSDLLLDVPSKHTPRIQEMHILIYHYICERLEVTYTGNG